jgi:hypothetical protein
MPVTRRTMLKALGLVAVSPLSAVAQVKESAPKEDGVLTFMHYGLTKETFLESESFTREVAMEIQKGIEEIHDNVLNEKINPLKIRSIKETAYQMISPFEMKRSFVSQAYSLLREFVSKGKIASYTMGQNRWLHTGSSDDPYEFTIAFTCEHDNVKYSRAINFDWYHFLGKNRCQTIVGGNLQVDHVPVEGSPLFDGREVKIGHVWS